MKSRYLSQSGDYSFSLRSLVVASVVGMVVFSLLFHFWIWPRWRQFTLEQKVRTLGGACSFDPVHGIERGQCYISFRGIPITDEDLRQLTPFLKHQPPMVVDLNGTEISSDAAHQLANELTRNGGKANYVFDRTLVSETMVKQINDRFHLTPEEIEKLKLK